MNMLSETTSKEVFVELNDEHFIVKNFADVEMIINRAQQMLSGRLWIGQDGGKRPLWQRMLGLKRYVDSLFVIEWADEDASLIFYDQDWSEYRALDKEIPRFPTETIRRKIAQGEDNPIDPGECLIKERAFTAIREFMKTRERPRWLFYHFVK